MKNLIGALPLLDVNVPNFCTFTSYIQEMLIGCEYPNFDTCLRKKEPKKEIYVYINIYIIIILTNLVI